MSSFIKTTPDWKRWACVDDYFGHHEYGYALMKPDDTWETFDYKNANFINEDTFYDMYYPKRKSWHRIKATSFSEARLKNKPKRKPVDEKTRADLILLITKFLLDNPELRVWQWLQALDVLQSSACWSWAYIEDEFNLTDDILLKRVKAAIARIEKTNKPY